jgi:hypothetical protein
MLVARSEFLRFYSDRPGAASAARSPARQAEWIFAIADSPVQPVEHLCVHASKLASWRAARTIGVNCSGEAAERRSSIGASSSSRVLAVFAS